MVASLRRPPGSAAAAEGALQHATARLPTDRGPPRRPRSLGSKFPPQILPPAHTRPLTLLGSARLSMASRVAARALTECGPSFRALHRMHRRLVSKLHPRCCRSLCWEQTRWTSRRRSLSHCASGGTSSMRTRATYVPPLRSQPGQIPDQLQMHRIRYAHVPSYGSVPHAMSSS